MNNIETIKLDNGLTIYLYKDNRKHSTFFEIDTFCGGFTKDFIYHGNKYHLQDGVAHILEHYLVECNERGNFLDLLGEKQMSTNATTSLTTTSFYFETVEHVAFGIRTVLEGIYNVNFNKERLEKLKGPIYQEVRGKKDMRGYHASHRRIANLFHNMTYRDIGGTLKEIEKTTTDDLEILYKAFYHPKNQFIVVAGNFDKDEVLNEINSFYNSVSFEEYDTELVKTDEKKDIVKKEDHFNFEVPLDYTEVDFKIDISNYSPKELLALDFYLAVYLNSTTGITSPLYQRLIKEEVINDSIHFSRQNDDKYMMITVGGFTTNMKKLREEIVKAICSKTYFDKEKYEIDRDQAILQVSLREENIFKMIFPFISNVVIYNYPFVDTVEDVKNATYEKYVEEIKKIDFSHYSYLSITKE